MILNLIATALVANGDVDTHNLFWPWTQTSTAQVTDGVAGKFSYDLAPDIAALQGTDVVLLYNPHVSKASAVVRTGASAIACLPDAGGDQHDGLLVADATGLYVGSAVDNANDPLAMSFTAAPVTQSVWAGATMLRVYPTPSGSMVVGLNGAGNKLVRSTYSNGVWTPRAALNVSGTVHDFDGYNHNMAGSPEFAVLTTGVLKVYNQALELIFTRTGSNSGNLEVARGTGPGKRDVLLWLYTTGSGMGLSTGARAFNSTGELTGTGLTGETFDFRCGDWDGDGQGDLLRMIVESDAAQGFLSVQTTSGDLSTGTFASAFADPPGTNGSIEIEHPDCFTPSPLGAMGMADLDNDTDMDLFVLEEDPDTLVESNATVRLGFNQAVDEEGQRFLIFPDAVISENGPIHTFDLLLGDPSDLTSMSAATHVDIEMWAEQGYGGNMVYVPGAFTDGNPIALSSIMNPHEYSFVYDTTGWHPSSVLHFSFAFVTLDESGTEVSRGVTRLVAWSENTIMYQSCQGTNGGASGVINGNQGTMGNP